MAIYGLAEVTKLSDESPLMIYEKRGIEIVNIGRVKMSLFGTFFISGYNFL